MARPRIAITKRRRTVITIVLMLLAWGAGGAIVNVAVAWAAVNTFGIWRDSLASRVTIHPRFLPPGSYLPGYVGDTIQVEGGWPCRCLCSSYMIDGNTYRARDDIAHRSVQDIERAFMCPSHVKLPGFAINTVFYAAVLWGLFAVPMALGGLRKRRRINRAWCPKCGYDQRANTSSMCPECGTAK